MGKTVLILAPIIVGAAVLLLTFWLGRRYERARRESASSYVSAEIHGELVEALRRILKPTDLDQAAYLPPPVEAHVKELLGRADEDLASVRRAQYRRAGF